MADFAGDFSRGPIGLRPRTVGLLSRLASARAKAAGLDIAPLMAEGGVTSQQIEGDNTPLEVSSQIKFVELVADKLQDPYLGFHLAHDDDLRDIGLLYYVLNSSDLLGDALRRAERYCTIANEGMCLRVREGKELAIIFTYVGVDRLSDRHQIEAWMTWLIRICRRLTGRRLLPTGVKFVHRRQDDCSEFDAFLGCRAVFGAETDELAFPATVRQMPVVNADPYLNQLLVKYCENARSRVTRPRSFRVDVENAIAPLLPHGKVRAPEIARLLGTSQRTLARRLAADGTTFARVLSELRAGLAKRYLREDLPISEIAWLLGYREVSAFTHAFKRWTGKTPRKVRSQLSG
jgi:AraC-like DNA-binding protein